MTKIYYNDIDIFSGLAPTPLIELSEEPIYNGNLWGVKENIVLNGQITGKCGTFEDLVNKQNELISRLSTQFKPLTIKEISVMSGTSSFIELEDGDFFLSEDGSYLLTESGDSTLTISSKNIYNWPITKIVNIDFDRSNYSQLLSFSATFECYDSGKFAGYYGVLDPVNSITFEDNEDGSVTLNHRCSARGINTNTFGTGALLNAKNYIYSITGWSSISGFVPAFVAAHSGATPILTTIKETIDRFNNSYSVDETWTYDPGVTGNGILRYSTAISSGVEDGTTQVTLNGSIEGGLNSNISNLRSRYSSVNFYNLASGALANFSNESLYVTELTSEVTEDPFNNKIDFSRTYDNNPEPNPYFVFSITTNINKIGKSSASIEGTFKYRGSCLCGSETGWVAMESSANNFDYYSLVIAKWVARGMTSALSPNATSRSITKNKNACEISVSLSYDEVILSVPSDLEYINATVSTTPSIRQYDGKPVFQLGEWYITNLGYKNRSKFSINGDARIKPCSSQSNGLSSLKNYLNTLGNSIILGTNPIMESCEITEGESDKKLINFSVSWSAMGSEFQI